MGKELSSSAARISLSGPDFLTILSQDNIIEQTMPNNSGNPAGEQNPFLNQHSLISKNAGGSEIFKTGRGEE